MMDEITQNLVIAAKNLCDAVEYWDNHHPQPRTNSNGCDICVSLYVLREVIAKAEGRS